MSMQDNMSDMISCIKNAGIASIKEISIPNSKMKASLAAVLKEEGYISDYSIEGAGIIKNLLIKLKYYNKKPVIDGIKRVSKPSCRIYCSSSDIPKIRNGLGIVILSTPCGIISGKKAASQNVGGEILCYVW
jgi:small subunit ribosomal protein S8